MPRPIRRWLPILLLPLIAAVSAAAASAEVNEPVHIYSVRYEIHFMDLHAAEALAWDQCPEALKDRCRVSVAGTGEAPHKGFLEVAADSLTHERLSKALVKADSSPRTQVFEIILLAASHRPGAVPAELPASAQKALADVRDFLPFKSYEVLDTAWLRTTRDVEGRIVGRQSAGYRVDLTFQPAGDAADKQLLVSNFRVREEARTGAASGPAKEGGKAASEPPASRVLIATSFGLKSGETIVVGTSKVNDGEALVVLLTAVP